MAGPGEWIELQQHENGGHEAQRIDDRRNPRPRLVRNEMHRHCINEERLEGDVQIAEQGRDLIGWQATLIDDSR